MKLFETEHLGRFSPDDYEGNEPSESVEDSDNAGSTGSSRVASSTARRRTIALHIDERPAEDVIAEGNVDAAEDAVAIKTTSWRRRPTATQGTT